MSTENGREIENENQLLGRLDIHEALRTEWTREEKNPPEDSEYTNWLVSVNFVPSDKLLQLVKYVGQKYGYHPKEAARRLLRYGVPEIEQTITDGLFADVKAYHDVATQASVHASGVSYGFSPLNENEKVPVGWGRTTGNRKTTFKAVWKQNDGLEWVSEKLCITKADAFRWACFEAGKALGEEGLLPDTFQEDIGTNVEEMRDYLGEKIVNIRGSAVYSMMEAIEDGNLVPVMEYCEQKAPELWELHLGKVAKSHADLEEEVFLFPERSLVGE